MIALGAHTGTYTTVFTAPSDGVYRFVAVGTGQFRLHDGTGNRTVLEREVVYNYAGTTIEQREMCFVMLAGDEFQHQNGPADLYGVRLGDEL